MFVTPTPAHPHRGSPARFARAMTGVAGVLLAGLAAGAPASVATASEAPARSSRGTFSGSIDGAEFRVEVPNRWNGTLVLYSHGYYPANFGIPPGVHLANRPETETWLLDHGYALAASDFEGRYGFAIEPALHDQVAVLEWFSAHIARPRRTIATGSSMGGAISVLLAERNPHRIDGVLTMCGLLDPNGAWNLSLDLSFAIRTLLARGRDIDLVSPHDPEHSTQALQRAVDRATGTPAGRARLALANALADVPGWNSVTEARPSSIAGQVDALAALDRDWLIGTFGPRGRVDLERRAGGNPSWNVGIDYARQLAESDEADLVREAYRAAGLDPRADLDMLAAAPRIAPESGAVDYMYRFAVPTGATSAPVVTIHNTGDGVVIPDHEQWYADLVGRFGDPDQLRQLYVDRGTHCAFSAAEEIVALRTLLHRVDRGEWPDTGSDRLNASATDMGVAYHSVFDFETWQDVTVPAAFTPYTPARFLRASR